MSARMLHIECRGTPLKTSMYHTSSSIMFYCVLQSDLGYGICWHNNCSRPCTYTFTHLYLHTRLNKWYRLENNWTYGFDSTNQYYTTYCHKSSTILVFLFRFTERKKCTLGSGIVFLILHHLMLQISDHRTMMTRNCEQRKLRQNLTHDFLRDNTQNRLSGRVVKAADLKKSCNPLGNSFVVSPIHWK